MANSEAKTHTFLTFPPALESLSTHSVQELEHYSLKAKPVFRKSEIELTAQHIEVTQDVILNCNAEMSVHLISLFVTCGLEESMLYTFLLYRYSVTGYIQLSGKFEVHQRDRIFIEQLLELREKNVQRFISSLPLEQYIFKNITQESFRKDVQLGESHNCNGYAI